ncbi:ParB/Srx family N-terminal domain-containing protein [Bradyrhizobium sp. CCGUVB1N3]|uniref:ParB/Srx family N-terminal domain-containing protein n=1 Tax=Bradyrhizobium sp. CCGUVB1N3 TaxID=2949629 RepID=UPI0020B3DDF0|nr:ParB/Srx family N-terminal domain-containing protein [Bradyrhizobium sp. CCGUVB1N3]MCP3475632.1 ParB/Srx family N-terminal domain-containing protein [Bradyrhizobium sp. CCGUVB1N3]
MSRPVVETWLIDRLRPYERNSRRHTSEQIGQIAASIREWGWTMPILAADDAMVLAGHGRLAAGKLLGIAEVPIIVARGWSENQKRAYVIADNRLTDASDWDDDMLRLELNDLLAGGFELALTGITEDELTKLSIDVAALEAMPELPEGDRSPYRDMTVRRAMGDGQRGRSSRAIRTTRTDRRRAIRSRASATNTWRGMSPRAKDILVAPISRRDADAANHPAALQPQDGAERLSRARRLSDGRLEGAMTFRPSMDKSNIQGLVRDTGWHEFLELNRLVFTDALPRNSEGRAFGIALRMIRKTYPQIEWVISFADGCQCGDGTIYRAAGFVLTAIRKNHSLLRAPDVTVVHKMAQVTGKNRADHFARNGVRWSGKGTPLAGDPRAAFESRGPPLA